MTTLHAIAQAVGIAYEGADMPITAINRLNEATSTELSFLDNQKYLGDLAATKAAAVFVSSAMAQHVPQGTVALVSDEPYMKLALATKLFAPEVIATEGKAPEVGEGTYVAPTAYLGKGCVIGRNAKILPGAFIGDNARVGDNTIIHANVTLYRDCSIGADCIIHAGCVIGSDGFGFAHTKTGQHVKVYQNGNVVIEDEVELGGNCAIDRAVFGSTRIKRGAKIDNLVHIAHNCVVGEYSILTGQVGLAGSTILGRNVVMGGQSATAGHLEIAPFTTLAARSGVTKNIEEPGRTFAGFPLMDHKLWLKLQGKLAKLVK